MKAKNARIKESFDDSYGMQIVSEDKHCFPLLHGSLNWSTVDIDALFCVNCLYTQTCSTCIYVG